jgi:uncharacterized YigZ family protein
MNSDTYKTIASPSQGIYKEKGSRFVSYAFPVSAQEEIKPILDKIRKDHHEARHHCYAYVIGREKNIRRTNDDGEPSGTAGRPIHGQIISYDLTNILIIVCRYFGGTLLGVSGLTNAYRSAARDALQNAEMTDMTVNEYYEVLFPYLSMNDVMKVFKEENITHSEQSFDMECRIIINFRVSAKEKVTKRLDRIDGLKYRYIETR